MLTNRTRRRVAGLVLALTLGAGQLLALGSAGGNPIADKQRQAQEIAAKLQQLEDDVERNANHYQAAESRLAAIRGDIGENDRRLQRAKTELTKRRGELSDYALAAYVHGGGQTGLQSLVTGSALQGAARNAYTTSATGDRQQLADDLHAAEREATDRQGALDKSKADAERAAAEAKQRRQAADDATRQYRQLNAQVQGELRQLVQQQRAAEERAREAHAYQQALAQAAQARPAASTHPAAAPATNQSAPAEPPTPPANTGQAPAVVPSGSGKGGAAVQIAMTKLGRPYVWGAAGPNTFDCSGLTQWSYRQVGISLPRVTWDQQRAGRIVPVSQIQVGDLVFYSNGGHMGMYAGSGQIIHAPRTGDVVKLSSLYMMPVELVVRVA